MATVTCPGCLERDQRIAALERRAAELKALVRDRSACLGNAALQTLKAILTLGYRIDRA